MANITILRKNSFYKLAIPKVNSANKKTHDQNCNDRVEQLHSLIK